MRFLNFFKKKKESKISFLPLKEKIKDINLNQFSYIFVGGIPNFGKTTFIKQLKTLPDFQKYDYKELFHKNQKEILKEIKEKSEKVFVEINLFDINNIIRTLNEREKRVFIRNSILVVVFPNFIEPSNNDKGRSYFDQHLRVLNDFAQKYNKSIYAFESFKSKEFIVYYTPLDTFFN